MPSTGRPISTNRCKRFAERFQTVRPQRARAEVVAERKPAREDEHREIVQSRRSLARQPFEMNGLDPRPGHLQRERRLPVAVRARRAQHQRPRARLADARRSRSSVGAATALMAPPPPAASASSPASSATSRSTSVPLAPVTRNRGSASTRPISRVRNAPQQRLERRGILGGDFDQEPRRRFGEQARGIGQCHRQQRASRARSISSPSPPAIAISAAATASPPSLRSWQAWTKPLPDRAMDRAKRAPGRTPDRSDRRVPATLPLQPQRQRAAQVVAGQPDEVDHVAGRA